MADYVTSCNRTTAAADGHDSSSSSSSTCSSSKRTKLSVSSAPDFVEFLHSNRRRNSAISAADSSRSSSNESLDIVKDRFKLVDLQLEEARSETETDVSTCINANKFSRENTPSSELRSSEEMDHFPAKSSSHWRKDRSAARKAPPQAEIEEFFTAAEKYDQKRFADKYNFDIVNDAPLEGRYQWVRLKQ